MLYDVRRFRGSVWAQAMTLAAVLLPAAARAQSPPSATDSVSATPATREAWLAAARDARAETSTPPSRTTVERGLMWYEGQQLLPWLSGAWHGVGLAGGHFPAGAGTALGVGVATDLAPRLGVDASVARSTRGYARADASIARRDLGGRPVDVTLHVAAADHPQQDFFGVGIDSRESDRSSYRLRSVEGGGSVAWRPRQNLRLEAGYTYLSPRVSGGTDTRMPSIDVTFAPATLPGYLVRTDYLRADLGVVLDRRDQPTHPHQGGRYSARFADYRATDGGGFLRGEVDLQQYVPLPNRYRTLAIRAGAVLTDGRAGGDVPVYFLPTLGGASTLRGFREFRFQDQQAVLMTAEYRWEAWWALNGAFFVDAGTVASRTSQLRLRDVEVSYGVGLRLYSKRAFVARLDLAFSREGFIPLMRFDHVF